MATTPLFNFLPHSWLHTSNIDPEDVLTDVFEIALDGKQINTRAMLRYDEDAKQSHLRAFLCEDDHIPRVVITHLDERRLFTSPNVDCVQKEVEDVLQRDAWRYRCQVDTRELGGEGICVLYLDRDGAHGGWNTRREDKRALHAGFRIEANSNLASDMIDVNSDVRAGLRWLYLPERERFRLSTKFTRGDAEELYAVVSALACHLEFGARLSGILYAPNHGFVSFGGAKRQGHQATTQTSSTSQSASPTEIDVLELWTEHINYYFGVCFNTELCHRYGFQRATMAENTMLIPWLRLNLWQPTHHERMEAALFLREWAQDKIPPDELRVLLPTLGV